MNTTPNPNPNMNLNTTLNPTNAFDNLVLVKGPQTTPVSVRVPNWIRDTLKAKAAENDGNVSKTFLAFALAGGLTSDGTDI